MGTEKIYEVIKPFLHEYGIRMGRNKLYSLLQAFRFLSKRKKKQPGTIQISFPQISWFNPGLRGTTT